MTIEEAMKKIQELEEGIKEKDKRISIIEKDLEVEKSKNLKLTKQINELRKELDSNKTEENKERKKLDFKAFFK